METSDRFLTVYEVAELLHVHVNTVRRLVLAGRLPAVRVSDRGDLRVRRSELEAFLGRQAVRV